MTGSQYRKAIEQLGLNQQQAGRLFGVSPRTAQNWALRGPSEPVGRLLAVILRYDISAEEIDD